MQLAGRKTLVAGMARTGVAAARFLAGRGALVTVSEVRPEKELGGVAAELRARGIEV